MEIIVCRRFDALLHVHEVPDILRSCPGKLICGIVQPNDSTPQNDQGKEINERVFADPSPTVSIMLKDL